MRIESIKVHNYRVFQDVHVEDIPNMAVFLGMNGVGKTTFFDIFGFLHDALQIIFTRREVYENTFRYYPASNYATYNRISDDTTQWKE